MWPQRPPWAQGAPAASAQRCFAPWPVVATRWLVLPRPLLFPRSLQGPHPQRQAGQFSGSGGEVSAPSIYGKPFFPASVPHLGSAEQRPCVYPGHGCNQGCKKAPSLRKWETPRTEWGCSCCPHAGTPPTKWVRTLNYEVPPCTSAVLAGRYPCRSPTEGRGRPNQGPRSSGGGGQWLRPGTRRTARKGRRNTGRKGAGCARGPPHRARALPCAHARSLRQALVAAAHSSGPAGGGASGSGRLAAARAPSCCSPGTGTEARLVPAPFTLSSSRLAQPVRVRGGPRQLEGGARGGVARRKKTLRGAGPRRWAWPAGRELGSPGGARAGGGLPC